MNIDEIKNEEVAYIDNFELDGVHYGRSLFNVEWVTVVNENPKVIFDVGCYDCGDSIRFKRRFPNCDVYSFEASTYRHESLRRTAEKYNLNLVPLAVSDVVGTATFYDAEVFEPDGVSNPRIDAQGSFFTHTNIYKSKNPRIKQKNQTTQVQTITIEKFCTDNGINEIDLLYVDVEGAELKVIMGLGNIRPKLVFVETLDFSNPNKEPMWYGDATDSQQLENYLLSIGYELLKALDADRLYIYKETK